MDEFSNFYYDFVPAKGFFRQLKHSTGCHHLFFRALKTLPFIAIENDITAR